ncbi:MAG: bifunctional demethylmenaquinone methyltransferase/2-methoxy-6-polyprenyl-1,4-benzoquinol methylase UbiE [Acidobacteria bacterium]|nr:bifunctional demethylmenaquinone methyltransferase/2-methoxy-6-polyprenyl-1,4-benzoquinol methylase UbiE [Acidobacteriota bacterium]MDW7984182.1 bifunctional demethylmenaquinone methyltransferase/2-methoxy-6-polyprenyl-1,4-benzoquinol methylase UbiE [Acidobacteriota bacterium]
MRRAWEIREMFDTIAARYDRANRWLSLGLDLRWRRLMACSLPLDADATILDVCTGSGDSLLSFWQSLGLRVGLDFSRRMLTLARRKARRRGAAPVWVEADALHLPFRAGVFDAVTIAFGLRNLVDPLAGLWEFFRVLRPGGWLAVLEFTLPRWQPWRWAFGFYLNRLLPVLGGWLTGHRAPYEYLRQSIQAFPHYEALQAWIAQAGFQPMALRPLTGGVATLYLARKPV